VNCWHKKQDQQKYNTAFRDSGGPAKVHGLARGQLFSHLLGTSKGARASLNINFHSKHLQTTKSLMQKIEFLAVITLPCSDVF
jgi:hypothetical protein